MCPAAPRLRLYALFERFVELAQRRFRSAPLESIRVTPDLCERTAARDVTMVDSSQRGTRSLRSDGSARAILDDGIGLGRAQ